MSRNHRSEPNARTPPGGGPQTQRPSSVAMRGLPYQERVTEVNRSNDRIMWVRLALEEFSVNICSVYALQTGCTKEEKEQFWTALQEEMEKNDESERCIIGGGMNRHIGSGYDANNRIHGGNVYGDGNEDGKKIFDFALSLDMLVAVDLAIAVTRRQKFGRR
ncbi:uncharacterized protein LOC125036992 [Penaeus chinensis]|uniref:uncharacterized protein LOC125036992 n=1 Tax=Penaeus chinensis TaxID=139456 RepID=UPI001FB73DDE|nr:uncharacterized protein LOC125036992 [Penaeus chinensis]